jgi:cytochrome c
MRGLLCWFTLGTIVLLAVAGFQVRNLEFGRRDPIWVVADADSRHGRDAIVMYGCYACHVVSGIREATGRVGPKLEEIDRQIYLAGVLPNSPPNMIRWIQAPQEFSPGTAMPGLGVPEQHARDMAAYLFRNP